MDNPEKPRSDIKDSRNLLFKSLKPFSITDEIILDEYVYSKCISTKDLSCINKIFFTEDVEDIQEPLFHLGHLW